MWFLAAVIFKCLSFTKASVHIDYELYLKHFSAFLDYLIVKYLVPTNPYPRLNLNRIKFWYSGHLIKLDCFIEGKKLN